MELVLTERQAKVLAEVLADSALEGASPELRDLALYVLAAMDNRGIRSAAHLLRADLEAMEVTA